MMNRRFLLIPLLSLLAAGCAHQPGKLSISSGETRWVYTQKFSQAYCSRSGDGDYDIVLVEDDIHSADGDHANAPLQPAARPPLRQIIHIRVFWRPARGTKSDSPSATNAAIDWYVLGGGTRQDRDMLHYEGIGFIALSSAGGSVKADLRNTTLKLTDKHGQLADTFGVARLAGSIYAKKDRIHLDDVLAQLKARQSDSEARQAQSAVPFTP
ncbi:MAG TPA: hypothetical protein VIL86_10050 [Tepidisphaeraceae bacterium]|jgi:hypothetical protein